MHLSHFINSVRSAAFMAAAVLATSSLLFALSEPVVSQGATDEFTVTQTVSDALSFLTTAGDVTMNGTLDALTGGTAHGTTSVRIRTNNAAGFNMTIKFSSTTAMTRNGGGGSINNFQFSTGTASYPTGFASASYGQFGFSVNASNTADVSDVFRHTGSTCGTGNTTSFTLNNCWRGASTTDETFETQLINTSAPTPASGSTSTIQFRVVIPPNPTPAIPNGTYVATATLTALEN